MSKKPGIKKVKCLDCGETEMVHYLNKEGIYIGKRICKVCSNMKKRKYYGLA